MSLSKKISILIFLLILLFAYTVYTFEYKTLIVKNDTLKNLENDDKNVLNNLKHSVEGYVENLTQNEKTEIKQFLSKIELIKKDETIILNGLFKNEDESKNILKKLNINKLGNIDYNKNVNIDNDLIEKLSILTTPLKDFFINDSKINILNGNVEIIGELKDWRYKDLFEAILKRANLNIKSNIKVPNKQNEEKTITSKIENNQIIVNKKHNNGIIDNKTLENNDKKIEKNDFSKEVSNTKQIQLEINKLLSVKKINFQRRSTNVTEDSYEVIKEIANLLLKHKNIKIEIAGHTDSRGAASLNKKISQDRANSVKELLGKLGIELSRLNAVGYGEDYPIAKDDKDGLSEINRRVEFNIIGE